MDYDGKYTSKNCDFSKFGHTPPSVSLPLGWYLGPRAHQPPSVNATAHTSPLLRECIVMGMP